MEAHEQQYFNVLLSMAVERFSERIVQRNEGVEHALERLRTNLKERAYGWMSSCLRFFAKLFSTTRQGPASFCKRWPTGR